MAVEAPHFSLFPSQQQLVNPGKPNGFRFGYNAQIGSSVPFPTDSMLPEVSFPMNRTLFQGKPVMNADCELAYQLQPEVSRKRIRDEDFAVSGEDVLPFMQQYQSEVDRIVSNHTKKLRMELEERQKQETRILVAAIGEEVMKKVMEKDEQIQAIGKLNIALQERVKSLYLENQLWRDLALSNEATANTLRSDLEQVLAHVTDEHFPGRVAAGVAEEEDVESCCDSSDNAADAESVHVERISPAAAESGKNGGRRMCRRCGEKESSVLLLPCRHLCLCTTCGSTLVSCCPVCSSSMNATVHVNLSS
ncbi:unnamed protein product [Cuscuta epithymum]|uniref:RING-type domain-containing protein n=1 Tax=Cuscuta epithymum TaxID=186058 RepID=A0AAV0G024_9ASTE|nr:unnamed protein product [Cuscuta epithymum]